MSGDYDEALRGSRKGEGAALVRSSHIQLLDYYLLHRADGGGAL